MLGLGLSTLWKDRKNRRTQLSDGALNQQMFSGSLILFRFRKFSFAASEMATGHQKNIQTKFLWGIIRRITKNVRPCEAYICRTETYRTATSQIHKTKTKGNLDFRAACFFPIYTQKGCSFWAVFHSSWGIKLQFVINLPFSFFLSLFVVCVSFRRENETEENQQRRRRWGPFVVYETSIKSNGMPMKCEKIKKEFFQNDTSALAFALNSIVFIGFSNLKQHNGRVIIHTAFCLSSPTSTQPTPNIRMEYPRTILFILLCIRNSFPPFAVDFLSIFSSLSVAIFFVVCHSQSLQLGYHSFTHLVQIPHLNLKLNWIIKCNNKM